MYGYGYGYGQQYSQDRFRAQQNAASQLTGRILNAEYQHAVASNQPQRAAGALQNLVCFFLNRMFSR